MSTRPPLADVPARARIIIADDHTLVRAGFRSLLSLEPDLEVVGEAATGREAIALCQRLRPDLILLDIRMPDLGGLEAARAIRREAPEVVIVILTMYDNPDYLAEALRAGAAGFVLKNASHATLLDTIRRARHGEIVAEPALLARLLGRVSLSAADDVEGASLEPLTPRERAVLALVAGGYTNRQIAAQLGISPATAKLHVEHVIRKLRVTDRTQAAVRALELGLLPHSSTANRLQSAGTNDQE